MFDFKWSGSEKKIARRVFDEALDAELAEIMTDFRARAAAIKEPADMWDVEEYLSRKRREIIEKYDFRYSQLPLVFGRLLREGRIREEQLAGLAEEKLDFVRRILSI
jgi:hypothetical protein